MHLDPIQVSFIMIIIFFFFGRLMLSPLINRTVLFIESLRPELRSLQRARRIIMPNVG